MAAIPAAEAKTSIDSLIDLLRAKGKMELPKIANTLGADQSVVEGWCKVLEQGGLCKITYELGRMYVEPISVTKEQAKALETTAMAESGVIEADIVAQKASLDKFILRLQTIGTSVNTAQKTFQKHLPEMEQQLSGINKIYSALEDENDKLASIKKKADGSYEDLNKRISSLQNKIESIDVHAVQSATAEYLRIEDTLKRAEELEDQLELLSKSKDRAIAVIRKSIDEQLKTLDGELTKAERNIEGQITSHRTEMSKSISGLKAQANSVKQLVKELSAFRKEKISLKKSLENARVSFNDEHAKITSRMSNTSSTLKAEIGIMLKSLDSLKSNFGSASKLYDEIEDTRRETAKAQKEIDELKEEADKTIDELRAVRAMKASAEAKSEALERTKEKETKIRSDAADLNKKINKLSKGVEGELE